jgi:hypothetical protein
MGSIFARPEHRVVQETQGWEAAVSANHTPPTPLRYGRMVFKKRSFVIRRGKQWKQTSKIILPYPTQRALLPVALQDALLLNTFPQSSVFCWAWGRALCYQAAHSKSSRLLKRSTKAHCGAWQPGVCSGWHCRKGGVGKPINSTGMDHLNSSFQQNLWHSWIYKQSEIFPLKLSIHKTKGSGWDRQVVYFNLKLYWF